MTDLITLSEAKAFCDETEDDRDDILAALVSAASETIANEVGGPIVTESYVAEVYDGDGETELWLVNRPVTSVSAVTIDGAAVTDYYWYRSGRIYRSSGWTSGIQNVTVTYTAGWGTEIPAPLSEAAKLIVQHIYKTYVVNIGGELGAWQALRAGRAAEGWPKEVSRLISRYRRKGR